MKNKQTSVEQRRADILSLVLSKGRISVDDIAKQYEISAMTVRRDLQSLVSEKLLKRTHGGVIAPNLVEENSDTTPFFSDEALKARGVISRFAASLIDDGDRIFINGSRTALDMLKYVDEKNVSVFTNNGWAINESYPKNVKICLSGGEIRNRIMTGEMVVKNLLDLRADKTFLGCAAFFENGEFLYNIPTEIGINEAMISRTKGNLYILADHTKFHSRGVAESSYGGCIYDCPYTLITDVAEDSDIAKKLRAHGINVMFAKEET